MNGKFLYAGAGMLGGLVLGYVIGQGDVSEVAPNKSVAPTQVQASKVKQRSQLSSLGGDYQRGGSGARALDFTASGNGQAGSEVLSVRAEDLAMLAQCNITPLGERVSLIGPGDPLVKVLDVSAEEAEQLNTLWKKVSEDVDQQRVANTSYEEHEDGSLTIFVKPFAEAGEQTKTELQSGAAALLGEARAKVFLETLKHEQAFQNWGAEQTGYKVINYVQSDDSSIYEIQVVNETGAVTKKWRTAHIPVHLKKLADAVGVPFHPLEE